MGLAIVYGNSSRDNSNHSLLQRLVVDDRYRTCKLVVYTTERIYIVHQLPHIKFEIIFSRVIALAIFRANRKWRIIRIRDRNNLGSLAETENIQNKTLG